MPFVQPAYYYCCRTHHFNISVRGHRLLLAWLERIDRTAEALQRRRPLGIDFSNESKDKLYKLRYQLHETNDNVYEQLVDGWRKINLATNIVESPIIILDVRYVSDGGKVCSKRFDLVTSVERVGPTWNSKTNSVQRRGRAGRVEDGYYYGLFSGK